MLTCWSTTKTNEPSSAGLVSSANDVGIQALNAIFGDANLKKSILSLVKTFGGILNKDGVNKVVTDFGKLALGVPFVGVGVQALVLIMNNVATLEQNKEKCEEIKKHVEFIKQYIEEIDSEEQEELLNESIICLIQNAWMLQHYKKEREGCVKGAWACAKGFLCAQSIASTLDHVARELQQIQRNLNSILLAQANRRQPHYRKPTQLEYDLSLYKVGLKNRINHVMQLLEKRSAVNKLQAIGVYGIGGIGKSTLLNGLRDHITKKGYIVTLEVLNEDSNEVQVQQNLVKQLTNSSIQFHDMGEGQGYLALEFKKLKEKKEKKKVCLIFDNLQPRQIGMIERILPDSSLVCAHVTYLIVSAREKHVVEKTCQDFACKEDINLYEPSLLNESEAKALFCKKAKMVLSQADNNANDLICNIVPLLGGLPLALEVYGSYFADERKRKPEEWKKVMSKLKNAQDPSLDDQQKVFKKIETSLKLYDKSNQIRLEDFMDAALFWKEKPWENAKLALLWEDDVDGLCNLEEKSLVSKPSYHDGNLQMHDILVSVARSLADHHNYKYYRITKEKPLPIKQNQLIGNLTQLRSLNLSKNYGFHGRLPHFLFSNLPKLCLFDLSRCSDLTKIPHSLSKLTSLKTLNLSFCSVLTELPRSLGELTNLEFIDLSECRSLSCLPDSIGKLTQLHTLKISNCDELSNLPSSFGHLSSLHTLDLSRSDSITSLPNSFTMLCALQDLNMSYCSELKVLPENFGNLTSLKDLNICGCSNLTSLPHSIRRMTSLQSLDASHCIALHDVPPSLFEPLQFTLDNLNFTSTGNFKIGLHFSKVENKSNWKFDSL